MKVTFFDKKALGIYWIRYYLKEFIEEINF